MRRKIVAVLLGLCLLSGLAGCQKTNGENPIGGGSYQPGATENTEGSAEKETEVKKDPEADLFQESLAIIGEYGVYESGYSILSYRLEGKSLADCGDYFEIQAVFRKPIEIEKPEPGKSITIVTNEFTGEKVELNYLSEGTLVDADEREYICYESPRENGKYILTVDSDDRVDADFFNGVLRIRKDAVTGYFLEGNYKTVSKETFANDFGLWFNGVAFDENGYVTELIYIGD